MEAVKDGKNAKSNRERRREKRQRKREESQRKQAERQRLAEEAAGTTPFRDINNNPLNLHGLCQGATCFIILSGPSIRDLDLSRLHTRGIYTLGINNSPAIFRPNFWTYSDRPNKFHDAIWQDPAVIKSVVSGPRSHLHKFQLQQKVEPGTFKPLTWPNGDPLFPRDMPGVIGHERNTHFRPEQWLTEPSINRGNSKKSAQKNGHPHCINTMFTAVKTAYALGFRVVFLLGCDFAMTETRPYAFPQAKGSGGVGGNNFSYQKMNVMFGLLKPHFIDAGFHVFNCNADSNLTVFDHVPYDKAIESATRHVPQDPLDTEGWYEV